MKLEFVKMNGLGNDFIMIDDFSREIELSAQQVTKLCDRHFGVGADGVILVRPSERPECAAYMHYINADGSLAEMCGNGVRCFAKYLVDRGYVCAGDGRFVADTLAGPKPIRFTVNDHDKLTCATVDMGAPHFASEEIPTLLEANAETPQGIGFVKEQALRSPWGEFSFTCVSMGNPHAVCFIDDWDRLPDAAFTATEKSLRTFDVDKVGAFFESHEAFPEHANIEFASVEADGIEMRVYERGCGETLACGTGACAVGVAATLTGRAGRANEVHLLGGTLSIEWGDDNHVLMAGPAAESFEGTVFC